jgi:osmoprotectant transport system ATP-binding protein
LAAPAPVLMIMASAAAIAVEDLVKTFPNTTRPAVDRCSFAVDRGELVVLLGPSGCGKTTLLKMINRLYEPDSGTIMIDGADATRLPATDLRRRIGYVIQQTGLFPHMRIEAKNTSRIDARIDELLELVGLPREFRRRYPRQLSGGEQQRVGIARALAADPSLMLMDEPFGAIDAITRARLQGELLALQRKLHKTILFVTHDVEEALRLADRMIVMREGRIVQFDTPLQILSRPADSFVAQLVDAGDLLRRLSLIKVGSVLRSRPAGLVAKDHLPRVPADSDMRAALTQLLQPGVDELAVVDGDDRLIGTLTLADLRGAIPAGAGIAEVERTREQGG